MKQHSTRQAATKLGISHSVLSKYILTGRVPRPKTATAGGMTIHLWSEDDIERVRKLLPKIANGRKTRYQKKQQAKAKPKTKKKPQARAPVPHKQPKKKKSKP